MSGIGIVHFGPGAFHRAHQADYIDRLLKDDPRWGIAAVSLRSPGTIRALAQQDGRYTLALIDREASFRVLQAHRAYFGPADAGAVRRQLRDPAVRIVSSTVTEKGYCLAADGTLDFGHSDIIHDLANPQSPASLVGWLGLGLADRRSAGLPAFTPLCCDNMASNGKKLSAAVIDYAQRLDPELAAWIRGEAVFPDTMVDSITPATDERLRRTVREQTGYDDAIPVSREAYAAWVVENVLPPGSPNLGSVGVTLAGDVAAFERAKLRILNGAHSTLAYLGLLMGHETVADAMGDAELAAFVERLVETEVAPALRPTPLNLSAYAEEIFERFRNPAIGHKLSQIAWDGSQKLPYRLLDSAIDMRNARRDTPLLAIAVAAWMAFVARSASDGVALVDPLADRLALAGRDDDPVSALLAVQQVFPERLAQDAGFRVSVATAFTALGADPRTTLRRALRR